MNKKFIILAAMAAVFGMSFTACSNDDEVKGGDNNPVNLPTRVAFNAYLDGATATRAYDASVADIQTDGMSVWAFDATTETAINNEGGTYFMGGYTAGLAHTWQSSFFKAAADYFWPEYNLNFVALTPQTGGGIGAITCSQAAATPGDPAVPSKPVMTVAVDVPQTTEAEGVYGSDTQKDIMIASLENQGAPSAFAPAALTFKHALSQIVFKGGVDAKTTIHKAVVKSIKLVNIASDGTITYTAADDAFAASAWGNKDKNYAANIVNANVTAKIGNDDSADDETPNAITGQDNNADGRAYQMMIMPQTSVECEDAGITENLSQLNEPVTGTYLLVNADLYANGDNVNKVISSATNVYIPLAQTEWAPGTKYTYTLKFGDNLLHPITFTASIAAWTDASKNVEF
jgi:hypothetical protein